MKQLNPMGGAKLIVPSKTPILFFSGAALTLVRSLRNIPAQTSSPASRKTIYTELQKKPNSF